MAQQAIDPTQSTIDYFRWKQSGISPPGTGIDLNIPPLDSNPPASPLSYVTNETYDRSYLTNLGRDPVDGINNLINGVGNAYQGDLDRLLNEMLTKNGMSASNTVFSSLVWTGYTSEVLNDYMKITLKKPTSEVRENLAARRLNRAREETNNLIANLLSGVATVPGVPDFIPGAIEVGLKNALPIVEGVTGGIVDRIQSNSNDINEESIKEIYGSDGVVEIYLPLPKQILEQYSHIIDNVELGSAAQLKSGLSIFQGAATMGGSLLAAIAPVTKGVAGALTASNIPGISSMVSGVIGSLDFLSASRNKAYNPVQESLYRTPQPRNFQWTFELMPTNQIQARAIAKIIQALKEHSSPINMAEILYDFPGFIEFEFYINNTLATFLPRSLYATEDKLKVPSIISNIQVDYTANGMYSHFVDQYPTTYSITLEFVETQPLDRNIIMIDNTIIQQEDPAEVLLSSVRNVDIGTLE